MRGRPGRGAVIGAVVSLVLVAVLFAPAVLQGSYDELTDSLVFLAAPLLLSGPGVGALIGVRPAPPARPVERSTTRFRRSLATAWMVVAAVAVVLALWTMSWATGLVDAAPLGNG